MATAYRSSQSVTNGTAGTSVTVSKPAGIVDTGDNGGRDQLIAFIAAVGAPTFTAPAGWTLITSAVDAGSGVTLKAYRKLASSEGASWTWTLGSSQRNWGWVGAYTGVDPDNVVADSDTDLTLTTSTTLSPPLLTFPRSGQGVSAGAAVRAASGAATTWTHTSTERADLSTNAGAGTDIAGVAGDSVNSTGLSSSYLPTLVASQAQTAGVLIALTLNPYFVPYAGGVGDAGVVVEAAFGVDPDGDSSTWTWTDLTSFVHQPAKLVLDHGRANRTAVADPSRMAFTLLNLNGEFTNPGGTYANQMVRNLPFRVRVTGFGVDATGSGYHRATAFLASMRPRWDTSTNFAVVDVVAQGRLRRIQQRTDALRSAAYRTFIGISSATVVPHEYWPFEDESDAQFGASATGGTPATVSGWNFAADSAIPGSAPLPTLTTGATLVATVPAYTQTGFWAVAFATRMPVEPAAETTLLEVITDGTAYRWAMTIAPGAPSAMHLRAYDSTGTSILNATVSIAGNITEAEFYDQPAFCLIRVTTNGSGIDYEAWLYVKRTDAVAGIATTGNLASKTHGTAKQATLTAGAGMDGATLGHIAVYTDSSYNEAIPVDALLTGNADELPATRFNRLCTEEGIPFTADSSTNSSLTMGPQGIASVMSLLREAETVEGCVVNDSGEFAGETGLLWFPARDDRENIDATLTLDTVSGQVAPDFGPILDDQDIVNDVEVSRSGGSSARATDETSIATEGRYREQVTVNTFDDTLLADMAGLRLNLGTVTGMRFPSVSWNLRRSPELAEDWMACRLFHRIDITNPPSQYVPDNIEAILEGYTEVLSSEEWTVRANLSPYAPYRIAIVDDPAAVQETPRVGSGTAVLETGISSSDMSLSVTTGAGGLWTTLAADFPLDVAVGGERIRLLAISGSSSPQTFTVSARSQNGVVSSHLAGAQVEVWQIATVGL